MKRDSLNKELILLILQFLDQEKYRDTLHTLERESALVFNVNYFEEQVVNGKWDEAERYLRGFISLDDNKLSMKIFFELRKQKYLEALDKGDRASAADILNKDLKVFSYINQDMFKEMAYLISLNNIRENIALSNYGDSKTARKKVMTVIKGLIEANPVLCDSLKYPHTKESRLRRLIDQSLNWQHLRCENPHPNPEIRTLFEDHNCRNSSVAQISASSVASNSRIEGFHHPTGGTNGMSNNNGEARNSEDINLKLTMAMVPAPPKTWKLTEINDVSQFRSLRLETSTRVEKILRLTYTSTGRGILALASDAIHLFWKWKHNKLNPSGKATTGVNPQVVQPAPGATMVNDLTDCIAEEAVPCFALTNTDYLMSASSGKVSLFNVNTCKKMATCMSPPPAATSIAFYPKDKNFIATGTDDNLIYIYNVTTDKVSHKLKGHFKKVTGLAFSHVQSLLISSGEDYQIIRWNSDTWEKDISVFLQIPERSIPRTSPAKPSIFLQFHQDQTHFLVAHESQIAIFETSHLQSVKQWTVGESMPPISHATFSSNCQLIYTSFIDGVILIFGTSNLQLQCKIHPSAYLGSSYARDSGPYPYVIAANPQDPNQFALGLTAGGVLVIEPLESEGKWGVPPPVDNGSSGNTMASRISID